MGELTGIFISDQESIDAAIGNYVNFGEVLGKHSDIYGILREKDIDLLTIEPVVIEIFEKYGLENGYNPLDYLPDPEEDTDDE